MKVINWLRKRVEEEMKVRGLASHSLLPVVDHCAVFINNYDGSGSAVEILEDFKCVQRGLGSCALNKVYIKADFDFQQVEHIKYTTPVPCCSRIKNEHSFVLLILKLTRMACPMILPYLFSNKVQNSLNEVFF
jgi:hypothetical protein